MMNIDFATVFSLAKAVKVEANEYPRFTWSAFEAAKATLLNAPSGIQQGTHGRVFVLRQIDRRDGQLTVWVMVDRQLVLTYRSGLTNYSSDEISARSWKEWKAAIALHASRRRSSRKERRAAHLAREKAREDFVKAVLDGKRVFWGPGQQGGKLQLEADPSHVYSARGISRTLGATPPSESVDYIDEGTQSLYFDGLSWCLTDAEPTYNVSLTLPAWRRPGAWV
jgi:hypothetical protein